MEASIKAFFAERKVAIYPPDGMGFDHCERSGLVIDGAFTSGSTHADEFIGPLSRVGHALHAELRDDEIARTMEWLRARQEEAACGRDGFDEDVGAGGAARACGASPRGHRPRGDGPQLRVDGCHRHVQKRGHRAGLAGERGRR